MGRMKDTMLWFSRGLKPSGISETSKTSGELGISGDLGPSHLHQITRSLHQIIRPSATSHSTSRSMFFFLPNERTGFLDPKVLAEEEKEASRAQHRCIGRCSRLLVTGVRLGNSPPGLQLLAPECVQGLFAASSLACEVKHFAFPRIAGPAPFPDPRTLEVERIGVKHTLTHWIVI